MSVKPKKVYIISGGSKGFGKAIADHVLESEHAVVATFSRKPTSFVEQMRQEDPDEKRFFYRPLDLSRKEAIREFVNEVNVKYGRVDVLINNAGIARDGVLALVSDDDIDMLIDVNLKGLLYLTRACIRVMLPQRHGKVINISSLVAHRGYTGLGVYSAAKAGIEGFTRSLAREVGRRGITVNVVAPGYLETEMTHGLNERQLGQITRRTPLGRLGKPEDVVPLVLFLASENADFITGQTFIVDGGLTI